MPGFPTNYPYYIGTSNSLQLIFCIRFVPQSTYTPVVLDDDEGVNGAPIARVDNSTMVLGKWFINANSEHLDKVIELFDMIYTDEFAEMCSWGVEGITYEVDEKGIHNRLPAPEDEAEKYNPERWGVMFTSNAIPNLIDWEKVAIPYTEPKEEMMPKSIVEFWHRTNSANLTFQEGIEPLAMASAEELEVMYRVEGTINTYVDELILGLVTGDMSLDNMPDYIEELKALGLDEYIAVFEARHQRFLDIAAAVGAETLYD